MSPDFEYAPDWANYVVRDMDKVWFWHEMKPYSSMGDWYSDGRSERVEYDYSYDYKERRS